MGSDSAPVEETIVFSSMAMPGMAATSEPVAMTMALASSVCVPPLLAGDLDLAWRDDPGRAVKRLDLVLLQKKLDALHIALHPFVLEGEHGGEVERRASP